jgi:hypothetical protein
MTPEEQRDVLDGRLHAALSEFDEMLLGQQQALEEKQRDDPVPGREDPSAMGRSGASGQSSASGGAGQQRPGRPVAEAGARGGGRTTDRSTGGSPDAGGLEGGQGSAGGVEGGAAQNDPRVPPDVGDGSDDDVVARQLREAAMKEDDPELREKLWDEYREYKKSAGS